MSLLSPGSVDSQSPDLTDEDERVWSFGGMSGGGAAARTFSPQMNSALRSVFFHQPLAVSGKRARKEHGAPPFVYAKPPPESLICPVCTEVFDDPCSTQCGHTFCKSCITESLSEGSNMCPVCRIVGEPALPTSTPSDSSAPDTLKAQANLSSMAAQLQVHCRFGLCEIAAGHYIADETGCEELLTIAEVEAHESTCSMAPARCEHAEVGCLWKGYRSDIAAHAEHCMFTVFSAMLQTERQQSAAKLQALEAKFDEKLEAAILKEREHWQQAFTQLSVGLSVTLSEVQRSDLPSLECKRIVQRHSKEVQSIALMGEWLLTGSCDNTICVWNLATWQCERVLSGHIGPVIALSSWKNQLISGSDDSTVRVWVEDWKCQAVLRGHEEGVNALAVWDEPDGSTNGALLLTGSDDNTVRVWNLHSRECQFVLEGHDGAVNVLEITGRKLLTGSDDHLIRVWNLDTWECERQLVGHTDGLFSIAVWGQFAFSGSFDEGQSSSIRVWNMDTWQCERELLGHTGAVCALAVDGTRRQLLSGSGDETIRVWSLDNWGCDAVLTGHKLTVQGIAVSGSQVISVSDDLTTRIWQ